MDIFKKMFQSEFDQQEQQQDASAASNKDEFRKPQWFEEAETDDELFDDDRKFAFQVFTSPLEMQKHFERQLQRLLEAVQDDADVGLDRNLRDDFLKPGFESKILKEFQRKEGALDTDLDGEIYPDQLYSLIQRMNPDAEQSHENILRSNQRRGMRPTTKLSDEELIMGRIHGTLGKDGDYLRPHALRPSPRPPSNGKPSMMTPMTPFGGSGGVFDGSYQGPKMFSQSVMTKTVRNPDGSYETTKVTQDSSGQKTTTVTRMVDGRQETVVTHDKGNNSGGTVARIGSAGGGGGGGAAQVETYSNRNIFVTKEGYAMPRNLW
ncbi:hypothetical protein KR093_005629 [Drosophila rubida]|uniref:Uncharacterized protein n=1 Tax=Drosophila rubida TaxID=30044 RepID=A0AAD4K7I6_9MUSC|nr:hypothetical protein KR093_005629 [Drosophila rubida]